jgi:multiple sugar transport system ATP-binding protein
MATVTFRGATRIYPKSTRKAVDRLDLEIRDGEFLVLVGPSGCGKTTSLRMLAGLEDVDEGEILIDDRDVVNLPPRARDIAMVFQNYALYPHMNVAENMGFALKIARLPKSEIATRVQEAAKILDLEDYLKRKPGQLSGGQRQRVAMGRAIVRQPRVFLMDEPLSNLDAKLRVATRSQIAALQRRLGITTVYVTHDQVEAMTMGDRVAVMKDGVLQQCDTPRVLYDSPINSFVAGFIGSPAMNLIDGTIDAAGVMLGKTVIPLPGDLKQKAGGPGTRVTVGLRPEAVELVAEGHGIPAIVNLVEELGAEAYVYAQLADHTRSSGIAVNDVIARVEPRTAPASGDRVHLRVREESILLFDPETSMRITVNGASAPAARAPAGAGAAAAPPAEPPAPAAPAAPTA